MGIISGKQVRDAEAARDPRWHDSAVLKCLYPELDGGVTRALLANATVVRMRSGEHLADLLPPH